MLDQARSGPGTGAFKRAVRTFGGTTVLAATLATGCVLSPNDGDTITSRDASITVEAYAANPGANVRIEAWTGGAWVTFDSLTANGSPVVWEDNLFPVLGSTVVPTPYWDSYPPGFGAAATIRFIEDPTPGGNQTSNPLRAFDDSGMLCLSDTITQGILYAGYACSTGTSITIISG